MGCCIQVNKANGNSRHFILKLVHNPIYFANLQLTSGDNWPLEVKGLHFHSYWSASYTFTKEALTQTSAKQLMLPYICIKSLCWADLFSSTDNQKKKTLQSKIVLELYHVSPWIFAFKVATCVYKCLFNQPLFIHCVVDALFIHIAILTTMPRIQL